MRLKNARGLGKRMAGFGMSVVMAVSLLPAAPASAETRKPLQAPLPAGAQAHPDPAKAGSIPASEDTLTYGQPFEPYTAGVENFRIPSLLTLQNGDLLAGGDARWEEWNDGGGIDSIASVSSDGGETWNYSFPIYFPDSYGYAGAAATTIIDPGVVEGPDGTIYFIADVNPTGSTTMYKTIGMGTGYVEVDGERYLALTEDFSKSQSRPTDDDLASYPYYIDHFDEDGHAQILRRSDKSPTGYGVDEWYNLYSVGAGGEYVNDLTQKQVNSDIDIQQNVYYKGSRFHVYNIDYIWVVESRDHGRTWEHPRDITDQIKREGENAILVSPGKSISTSSGDIVIGLYYSKKNGANDEKASMIYSTDNGETWERTEDISEGSSENEIVELLDGTLRMFYRNGHGKLTYADYAKDPQTGKYEVGEPVIIQSPGIVGSCNLSVVSYSQKINGKQALLISCPKGDGGGNLIYQNRNGGRIFTFLIDDGQEGNPAEYYGEFRVPGGEKGFVYSSMTELSDGRIGLLWEPNHSTMYYDVFDIYDILPQQAELTGVTVNVELETGGEAYERTYGAGAPEITAAADPSVAKVTTERETRTHILCDHVADLNANLGSFSADVNENISLEDAEFAFSAAGEGADYENRWNVYNKATGQYLTNNSSAGAFFSQTALNDMKFEPVSGTGCFTACKGDTGNRYIMFHVPQMNFNSTSGKGDSGIENMTLFERKEDVAEEDLVPGYRQASSIEEGHSYLITYLYEGRVMALYPENGTNPQTKLVGTRDQMQRSERKKVKIEGAGSGVTQTVIDGVTYRVKVTDRSIVLGTGESYEIPGASQVSVSSGDGVVTAATYSQATDGLFDHNGADGGIARSLESFSKTKNDGLSLENAALTFTLQDGKYQARAGNGTYLSIQMNWQDTFFSDTPCNLSVNSGSIDGTFKIARADHLKNSENGNIGDKWGGIMGHLVFYFRQMNFRSHGMNGGSKYQTASHGIGEYGTHADYNLTLLEKSDGATDGPLPGYRVASEVASGSKYLVSYLYDDSVIVLYPADGAAEQTKLARRLDKGVRITAGGAPGETAVTVDGTQYRVKVAECGHASEEKKNEMEASCTQEGYSGDMVCASCKKVMTAGSPVPAFGHAWEEEGTRTPVTEEENGTVVYACRNDGSHTKTVLEAHANVYVNFMSRYRDAQEKLGNADRYEAGAVSGLREIFDKAKALIEQKEEKPLTNAAMVPAAAALRKKTENALASRDALEKELDAALRAFGPVYEAGKQAYYSDDAWSAFQGAYEAAFRIADTASYLALDAARSDLQRTGDGLRGIKYRMDLQALYDQYKDLTQGDFTDATWGVFAEARSNARGMLEKEDASAEELLEAKECLQAAADGLRTETEALAPGVRYTAPAAGAYPQVPVILPSGADDGHQEEIADLAKDPVNFTRVDTAVEPLIRREDGIWGFNDQLRSGAANDKFDVYGANPIVITFKLYLKQMPGSDSDIGILTKGNRQYAVQLKSDGLCVYMDQGSWSTEKCAITGSQLNRWLDVVTVIDGKGKMKLYVDGGASRHMQGNENQAVANHYDDPFAIGCRKNSNQNEDQKFTSEYGYLADVQFYSGADMTDEMKAAIDIASLGDDAYEVVRNLAQSMEPTANITVSPYNAKTIWRQAEGEKDLLAATDRFEAGVTYEAVTTFTANGDYEFLDSAEFLGGVVKNIETGLESGAGRKPEVSVSDDKKTMTVTVSYAESASSDITVALDPSEEFDLAEGETRRIRAITDPAGTPVTWRSGNDEIATVSDTGLVRAVKKGKTTITAVPEGGTGASVTVNVTEKEPEQKLYTIFYSASPAGSGSIAARSQDAQGKNGKIQVEEGGDVTLTAEPNSGYTFDGWYADGETQAVSRTLSYTVTDVRASAKYVAKMRKAGGGEIVTHTVAYSANPPEAAEVSATCGQETTSAGSVTVEEGSDIVLTAEPNSGYTFDGWYADGETQPVSGELSYTVTDVRADAAYVAEFTKSGGGQADEEDRKDLVDQIGAVTDSIKSDEELKDCDKELASAYRNVIDEALAEASRIAEDSSATKGDIDEALEKLREKAAAAERILTDGPKLQEALKGAEVKDEPALAKYPKAVRDAYRAAGEAAKQNLQNALDDLLRGEPAKEFDADEAVSAMQEALKGAERLLVKAADVQSGISRGENRNFSAYTTASVAAYKKKLAEIKKVLEKEGVSAADLEKALTDIKNAEKLLQKAPAKANKTKLDAAIRAAKKKNPSLYTKESAAKFATALAKAEAVYKKAAATQTEVNAALTALQTAEKGLVALPVKGEKIVKGLIEYKVTKAGSANASGTAEVFGLTKSGKKKTTVKIPLVIEKNGCKFKVTAIGAGAFQKNKKLKKIELGANVTVIGKNAFSGCRKLKTVTLKGKTVKSAKSGAFKQTAKNLVVKVPKGVKKSQKNKLQSKLRKCGNKKLKVK